MDKKEKKPNILKRILDSLYYDHHETRSGKPTKRLPIDQEVDRIKANTPPTY
jgi:hypothetical protein